MTTWGSALVTGASSGIGEEFARTLAGAGTDLVLVARRESVLIDLAEELRRAHGVRVEVLAADLATEDGVDRVAARLADTPTVDLLVNNAGISTMGRLHRLDPDRERMQIRLNIEAVALLAQAHLAALARDRRAGALVNVASMSALNPFPTMATYGASKAFVVALSENLAASYGAHGVRVQALCPGFVRTDMAAANDLDDAASNIPGFLWLTPATVVRASLAGLERGAVIVVPSRRYRAIHRLSSAIPRPLRRALVGRIAN